MKKWVRNLLKGTSLSTALFVFQACYGMPPGYEDPDFNPETEFEESNPADLDDEALAVQLPSPSDTVKAYAEK